MRRAGIAAILLIATAAGRADEKKPTLRVACVGDSITAGSGYPAALGKLLGPGYEVRNFGVSGRTLLTKGDYPYVKEQAYRDALAFKPDLVVILLGTNDTKAQNWRHAGEFTDDYEKLVGSFRALPGKPKVYLCTPVPAYKGNYGITDAVIKDGVRPKVEALGKKLKLPVVDLYAALGGKPELFPDQVHPNAAGGKLMAEAVAGAIRGAGK